MRHTEGTMMKTLMAMVMILGLTTNAIACDEHGTTGFLPENKMNIPVGLKSTGGITEAEFNNVITKIETLYKDEIARAGGKLVVQRNWTDGTVNAYAMQQGAEWIVAMFGGLARHPQVTKDGFAVVVCHELGHHIGGAPKKDDFWGGGKSWATNEGQADYFGTMKCLRKLFQDEDNAAVVSKMKIPALVTAQCSTVYKNANEIAICQRSSMAGYSVGRLFNDLTNDGVVDFAKPDPAVVKTTYDAHPASQCRLDTYFQASLCDKAISDEVSQTDEFAGVCSKRSGDSIGNRPTCWYKESN